MSVELSPAGQQAHDNKPSRRTVNSFLSDLVRDGLLSESDKKRVFEIAQTSVTPVDQILCNLGVVTEDALAASYAKICGLIRWNGQRPELRSGEADTINRRFLESRRIFPLSRANNVITAALVDPLDEVGITGLEFALGAKVAPQIVTASEFERLLAAAGGESEDAAPIADGAAASDDAAKLKDLASAEPAVRLVNRLIGEASRARASDIHIEPKERDVHVRRRVDGVLTISETLTRAQGLSAISRLKILAGLDIAERRRPQDGRLSFPVAGRPIDMRVSTTPTIYGESVVIRLLDKPGATQSLDTLGFAPSQGAALNRLISQPNGILLITGPTGSGKTTTLYALLEILAKRELKILTIEDPVEYRIEGVSQTQVNPAIGLTFAGAMRSFLRHDPDVIMVGEMRDLETASTAVQAALTGHLVLSTLHTNDASSAITRLLDMGVEEYLVGSTLLGVVAQRLVRRTCGACRNDADAKPACQECHGTGYAGRLAVSEVLEIDDGLKACLHTGVTASEIRARAAENGFIPIHADGEAKTRAGLTDRAELLRVLGQAGDV